MLYFACRGGAQPCLDVDAPPLVVLTLSKAAMMQILALPAKRVGFFAMDGTLIARSDSNGEDLEAFAGAGGPCLLSLPASDII